MFWFALHKLDLFFNILILKRVAARRYRHCVVKSTSDADKKKTITEQVDPNQVDKDQVDKDQVDPNQVDQDQVDQDQKNTEIGTAIDTTTQAVQKNIEAIKEAANTNNEKKVTDNLEGYIEEFKAAMPKYEGMTEEEKKQLLNEINKLSDKK